MLIVNPISGTLSKEGLDERVRRILEPAGFAVETFITEYAGHGAELASRAVEEHYYAVIAAGGDGTVNEIASRLAGSEVALGILPFGSGNGLARHLGLSIDLDHALRIIAADNPLRCDYGSVNGLPFFCTFGIGFDAKVSDVFSRMPSRGLTSYIRSALKEYLKYSPLTYEITSGGNAIRVKAFIVAVCNASQYGNNAFIAPHASIRDGLLDITIIHAGNPLTRALAGVELFTGRIDRNILIQTMRVREATIRRIPGTAHIDGEPRMMPETMHVRCHPHQLRLFVDPGRPSFQPFLTPIRALHSDTAYLVKENLRHFWMKFLTKLSN